jgi:hypothetical protein
MCARCPSLLHLCKIILRREFMLDLVQDATPGFWDELKSKTLWTEVGFMIRAVAHKDVSAEDLADLSNERGIEGILKRMEVVRSKVVAVATAGCTSGAGGTGEGGSEAAVAGGGARAEAAFQRHPRRSAPPAPSMTVELSSSDEDDIIEAIGIDAQSSQSSSNHHTVAPAKPGGSGCSDGASVGDRARAKQGRTCAACGGPEFPHHFKHPFRWVKL